MATSLANAYVQILPTAKGMKSELQKIIGDNMPSGEESGGKFGGGLVSKLKSVIAVAGIGKALSATISEGSELQQSIGGIETLFKESADKVKANAAQAYRTAGMSANEYMQLTTSFSASLLSSLANDTSKSADIADMAMTDMSDNTNKMGTSMEDIKNAYQGFAKQNYTMLDNLKLGYGGTKTEMQRLLADAQKISGVKYDINNLADVYSAIHVIQGELDITGTTAKEASSTISGSFSSMSAAFKNVLGQITLGMDVKPALNELASTIVTFVGGNLVPAVWNIISALPSAVITFTQSLGTQIISSMSGMTVSVSEGITSRIPEFINSASTLVSQFCATIQTNLPTLLQNGVEFANSLVNGILQNLPVIISSATDIVTTFVSTVISQFPAILDSGAKSLLNLVNGIINNLPQIATAAVKAVLSLVATIGQNLPKILETGITIIGKLAAGLIQAIPSLIAKIPQIITSIKNAFSDVDWLSIGSNIIKGIAKGLANAGGALWNAVKGVLGNFKEKVLSFFGIHSPATWGIYVGDMVDKGVAKGLVDNSADVIKSAEYVTNAISEPIGKLNASGSIKRSIEYNARTSYTAANNNTNRTLDVLERLAAAITANKNGDSYFCVNGRLLAKAIAAPMSEIMNENERFDMMLKGEWA